MKKHKTRVSLPDAVVKRYDHASLAAAMREAPGEWVKIDKDVSPRMYALATKWRETPPLAYRDGIYEWRAVSAGYGTGKAKLFGRLARRP